MMFRGRRLKKILWIGFVLIAIGVLCASPWLYEQLRATPTIQQGIWGRVSLAWGDAMPQSPPHYNGGWRHVSTTVFVRESISRADAEGYQLNYIMHGYYLLEREKQKRKLIKKVHSNWRGFYEVALPPGRYSILVYDRDPWWNNLGPPSKSPFEAFDSQGGGEYCQDTYDGSNPGGRWRCTVNVKPGQVTRYNIHVNHTTW